MILSGRKGNLLQQLILELQKLTVGIVNKEQRKLNDKELYELLKKELEDENIGFWFTHLSPKETGLTVHINASCYPLKSQPKLFVQRAYGEKHDYRNGYFIITVEARPRIIGNVGVIEGETINQVFEFIQLNQRLLLQHWYHSGIVDSLDVCSKVRKVKIN